MESKKMLEDLTKESEILRKDLSSLEELYSMKKEQYIRIQGAIEALSLLENKEQGREE
jgi:uncharacterized protein YaaN involved in tellurite resistance